MERGGRGRLPRRRESRSGSRSSWSRSATGRERRSFIFSSERRIASVRFQLVDDDGSQADVGYETALGRGAKQDAMFALAQAAEIEFRNVAGLLARFAEWMVPAG